MKKKIIIAAILMIVMVFVFGGCAGTGGCGGAAVIARPAPQEGAEVHYVTGSCTATLSGNEITVSGTSDIMDGTNGTISILGLNGKVLEEEKITKEGDNLTYTFTVDPSWPDIVYGFITFGPKVGDSQSRDINDVYGRNFQNVDGDEGTIVWDKQNLSVVFKSEAVELG
ncbi:MAG: hypothetical protein ACOYJB_02960 [Christensenellaceae bacterium]